MKKISFLFLALITILSCVGGTIHVNALEKAQIPADAFQYNGHSYKLYTNQETIYKAIKYCQSLGGHLLELQTGDEMTAIREYRAETGSSDTQLWIGAIRYSDTSWQWMSGNAGEANIYAGNGVTSYGSTDFGVYPQYSSWRSYYAFVESVNLNSVTHGFICEWDQALSKDISKAVVTISKTTYEYDGKEKKPSVTVKLDDKKLVNGTDYKISYTNNTEISEKATITITGIGTYQGKIIKTFKILPKQPTITLKSINSGEIEMKSSEVKGASGYQFTYYPEKNNKNAKITASSKNSTTVQNLNVGIYYYVKVRAYTEVNGKKIYGSYSKEKKVKVYTGKSISAATVKFSKNNVVYTYNGKAQKPEITITIKSGFKTITLVKDTDYSLTYSNNIDAGNATIKVTGKGKYYGTIEKTFTINPKKLSYCEASLPDGNQYSETGENIYPAVVVLLKSNGKALEFMKDFKLTYDTDSKSVGEHKITVAGIGNYTGTIILYYNIEPQKVVWPMEGSKCSWSGYKSATWSWGEYANIKGKGDRQYHLALDLNGTTNNVYSIADGTVVAQDYNSSNGNYIIIMHTISNKTVYSFYAHLASIEVSKNKTVKAGDIIGVRGNTGSACPANSPHLHFSIVDTLKKNGSYDGYGYKYEINENTATHNNIVYYNPKYVIENDKLPQ